MTQLHSRTPGDGPTTLGDILGGGPCGEPDRHPSERSEFGLRAETASAGPAVTVVSVAGVVDLASADLFESVVLDALSAGEGGRVVLELNRVTFLAARGLAVLGTAQHHAHHRGTELVLVVDDVAPAATSLRFLTDEARPVRCSTVTAAVQHGRARLAANSAPGAPGDGDRRS